MVEIEITRDAACSDDAEYEHNGDPAKSDHAFLIEVSGLLFLRAPTSRRVQEMPRACEGKIYSHEILRTAVDEYSSR